MAMWTISKDELGDLLLQVVFHSRMAQEAGTFAFGDVVGAICEKLLRRHPMCLIADEELSPGAVGQQWNEIKAQEKAARAHRRALSRRPKRPRAF